MKRLILAMAFVLAMVVGAPLGLAQEQPVSMLIQVSGAVEFAKDGKDWKPVTRNKYLFAGTRVKTGADGGGKLIDQANGTARTLGANSEIEIAADGIKVISGSLSDPEAAVGDLLAGLKNRLEDSQRYTTVRRSTGRTDEPPKLRVAKEITLSESYPDLVWEGFGKDYSYRLEIDGNAIDVPATAESMVRYTVSGLTPGQHSFAVTVLKDGTPIGEDAEKSGTLVWLSSDEDAKLRAEVQKIQNLVPGDAFVLANLFDARGLMVPAMDNYRKYFEVNKDDNELRPLLIRTYNSLKLTELRKQEAQVYNQALGRN